MYRQSVMLLLITFIIIQMTNFINIKYQRLVPIHFS